MSFRVLINFILLVIFIVSAIIFVFWHFGIFKKEAEPSSLILDLKEKINFVNGYFYQDLNNYFKNLPATKIEIPEVKPEEIGRTSLF